MTQNPFVLLTVRGTTAVSDQGAARKLHNETAGSEAGIAMARSLGDLSHKVYVPVENSGAKKGELLFIDFWQDPERLGQFFSNPAVIEQGKKLFTTKDPTVWMPARGAFGFHLPAPIGRNDRYVGLLRAPVRSPEEAIEAFRKMVSSGVTDARRRGQLSHDLYVKLADGSAPEVIGVDVWCDLKGMQEQYASQAHGGLAAVFTGAPQASIWEQAGSGWSEW